MQEGQSHVSGLFRGLAMSLTYDNWMDEVFGERSLRMAIWMTARSTSWQRLG